MPLPVPTEQSHLTHPKYRADIDGLRAIAVLSVVSFHAFPDLLNGGFVGVDIFFVISGFLISSIIISSLNKGTFSFTEFYARRVKRIFPALTLVLLSCLSFGWFSLFANEYSLLGKHSVAGAAFYSNFVFWKEAGYFDAAAELKPLLHLWSLGIEEQFYIFWPILLFFAYQRKLNLLGVMLSVALLSFACNISWSGYDPVSAFYSPLTRAWELLIGSLLAYINLDKRNDINGTLKQTAYSFLRHNTATTFSNNFKSGFGLVLISLAVLVINKNLPFPSWWAFLPTIGTFLVISAGSDAWLNRNVLSSRVLVFVGLISFPLYLWHWPLLSFARILESGKPTQETRLALIMLSFLLAWLTYRIVERRVRFLEHSAVPIVLILALSSVAGLGYLVDRGEGLSFRHQANEIQLESFNWDKNGLDWQDDCRRDYQGLGTNYCLHSRNKSPTVVLIGDSHANSLFYGLERFYAKSQQGLLSIGSGGCPPLYNVESWPKGGSELCGNHMNRLLNYVATESSIKTVVLAGSWTQYTSGNNGNKERDKDLRLKSSSNPLNQNNLEIFKSAMDYTLTHLVSMGKEIVFVFDIIELGFDPKICIKNTSLKFRAHKTPCVVERKLFEKRNQIYRVTATEILRQYPTVKTWDPTKVLCDEQYCWAMKGDKMLYRDDNHLSLDGSLYLGDYYKPE